jgi:hypothetical protein
VIRLVFPEGDDARIREAAAFLEAEGLATTMLLTGVDDAPQARELIQDGDADAIIGRSAIAEPNAATPENTLLILDRTAKNGRPEQILLAEFAALPHLDPEKLLNAQPRAIIFPGDAKTVDDLQKAHPLWLISGTFHIADIDDINLIVTENLAQQHALAALFANFTTFRPLGPFSTAPILAANISETDTTADIIAATEFIAKIAKKS